MKCKELGCRKLKWVCEDCGRVACRTELHEKEWISVKDRLPSKNAGFLTFLNNDIIQAEWHKCEECKGYFVDLQGNVIDVLYWMPLPELPEPPK